MTKEQAQANIDWINSKIAFLGAQQTELQKQGAVQLAALNASLKTAETTLATVQANDAKLASPALAQDPVVPDPGKI